MDTDIVFSVLMLLVPLIAITAAVVSEHNGGGGGDGSGSSSPSRSPLPSPSPSPLQPPYFMRDLPCSDEAMKLVRGTPMWETPPYGEGSMFMGIFGNKDDENSLKLRCFLDRPDTDIYDGMPLITYGYFDSTNCNTYAQWLYSRNDLMDCIVKNAPPDSQR